MPNNSTTPSPADRSSSSAPTFKQLPRAPLIPERVLRSYGAYCAIDTRFRAAARLLQCLWLRDQDIPTAASINEAACSHAGGVSAADHNPRTAFGSILSREAANAGRNFLSPAIHRLTLQEWLMCEDGACIDEERLFGNALSSMPLVFNLFGPLLNLDLASAVFQRLLPGFVRKVVRFQFETAPLGRRNEKGLNDRTAFDVAVHTVDSDGEPGIVFIECKFSETLDNEPARLRDRYNEASREVRLYDNPDSLILRAAPIEQLWREGMTAQLAVDHRVAPKAVFLAIGPELNRRVQGAFKVYQGELIDADRQDPGRVPFVPLTLEAVIRAIADAGATDHARALWDRYCDFDRVYRLVMQELANDTAVSSTARPATGRQTPATATCPPVRRRLSGRGRAKSTPLVRAIRPQHTGGALMAPTELLTEEDRIRLFAAALADERDHFPVVKLFTPDAGATWLISEVDPDEPDRLFGLCDAGVGEPELGYVSLAEIMGVRGRLGLPVERDLHFVADKPLSAYAQEALAKGRIVA